MIKQSALLLLFTTSLLSNSNILGVSYIALHTENQAPSVLASPYEFGYSFRREFSRPQNDGGMRHLLVGVEYLQSGYELNIIGPEGNSLGGFDTGVFREFSYPVTWRYFYPWPNGVSGYGYGPFVCLTHQFFSFDPSKFGNFQNVKAFQENVYITSLGLNGLFRLGVNHNQSRFTHIDFEVQGMLGLLFLGGGQDLSDYSHAKILFRISLGLGSF